MGQARWCCLWSAAGVTFFGALPVALLVRSPGLLALVSQVSVAFIFFFALVVMVLAMLPSSSAGGCPLPHCCVASCPARDVRALAVVCLLPTKVLGAGTLLLWRPEGALIAFPVVAYGFTAHQFLFSICSSLKAPTVKNMTSVVQQVCETAVAWQQPVGAACLSRLNSCMQALFCCTMVYLTVGVCGYTAFKNR